METSLKFEEQTLDLTSDIWSLGCTILQFLLDKDTWNIGNYMKQFGVIDKALALQKVKFLVVFRQQKEKLIIHSKLILKFHLMFRQWKYISNHPF